MSSWKSATRSPIAAFPSPSTSRTPPSGHGSGEVGREEGAPRAGPGFAVTAVGPGAALGAGGAAHPAAPAHTPAATSPGIHRFVNRFVHGFVHRFVRRFAIIR
ncbi:hypothetical protein ACGFZK_36715 [Streptomyces sp. NPDC048257]|uniref:hypothetical protein n=1 Tax=Streptomyces sp. NPDC048257 TaxID=3365526 RepID=UPI003721A4B4